MRKLLLTIGIYLIKQLEDMDKWARRRRVRKSLTPAEDQLFIDIYNTVVPHDAYSVAAHDGTHNEPEMFFIYLDEMQDIATQNPFALIDGIGTQCFVQVAELAGMNPLVIRIILREYDEHLEASVRKMVAPTEYVLLGEEHNVYVGELILN